MSQITTDQLSAAICATRGEIKLVIAGLGVIEHMRSARALEIARAHVCDCKVTAGGRVIWIRPRGLDQGNTMLETNQRRAVIWQRCYRTAEAPVLQPSIEWLRSRRSCVAA